MNRPALLFDLDGTLVDSAAGIAEALSILRAERGGAAIDGAAVRPLVSLGADRLVAGALGELARHPAEDLAAFRAILGKLPANPESIFPHVREALSAFAELRHPMAIVTNKPHALACSLLEDLDLARYFGTIVGGDSCPVPKPHRAPLDLALAAIGGRCEAAIMIGDSEVDAGAAAACAMPFILYDGGYGADQCGDFSVAAHFGDFADLPALIANQGA